MLTKAQGSDRIKIMKIGAKIKELRKAQRMKLVELSKRSGIALATLSRIEHEKMTGTVESHMRVAKALGMSLSELYSEIELEHKRPVEKQEPERRTDVFVQDEKSRYELLTTNVLAKKMMPVMFKLAPGGGTVKEENRYDAEKFIYVLKGKIEAVIEDQRYALEDNDTLYFDSSAPHQFKNIGNAEAQFLCIMTPPAL